MSEVEKGAAVRIPPPLVFAALIAIALGIHFAVRAWPTTLDLDQRLVAGAALVVAGLALGFSAYGLFRKTGQHPKPWAPTPSIITTGSYRFTRNPMYVSMVMTTVAIGLFANASWCVLAGPLGLVIVHVVAVRAEETYLSGKFGREYDDYRARVPRYL
jgi:protein-S-isoprenylcysteine O-methyltransferase Ste14